MEEVLMAKRDLLGQWLVGDEHHNDKAEADQRRSVIGLRVAVGIISHQFPSAQLILKLLTSSWVA